jgi:hypothetical protein
MSRAVESRDTPGSGNPGGHDPGRGHRVTPGAPLARRRPPSLFGAGLPAVDVTLPFEETFGRRIVARSGDRPERSRIDPVGRIRNPPYGKWNHPLHRHRNPDAVRPHKPKAQAPGQAGNRLAIPGPRAAGLSAIFFHDSRKTAEPADWIKLMPRRES